MKKIVFFFLCLNFFLEGHGCPFSPLEEAGQGLWAQQYVGADLLREKLKELDNLQFRTRQLVGIWDANSNRHGEKVSQIVAGPFPSAVVPVESPHDYHTQSPDSFYRQCRQKQNCPLYINHSVSWGPLTESVVREMNTLNGTVVITSAGNGSSPFVERLKSKLSRDGKLIVVANLDTTGNLFKTTNYSAAVTIAAPAAKSILSYDFSGSPVSFGGTSGAAPLVTGSLTAFTLMTNYILTVTEAIRLLHKTAIPFPNLPSFDGWASPGILNAYRIGAVAERLNQMCQRQNRGHCMARLLQLDETYQFERESELLFKEANNTHTPTKNCDKSKVSAHTSDQFASPQPGLKCEQLPHITKMRMAALLNPYNAKAWKHLASSLKKGEFYLAMQARAERNGDEVILDQICRQGSSKHLRYFSAPYLKTLMERNDCSLSVQTQALSSLLYNTERADFQQFLIDVMEHPLTDRQVLVATFKALVWNYYRIAEPEVLVSRIINHPLADESLRARVRTWISFGP